MFNKNKPGEEGKAPQANGDKKPQQQAGAVNFTIQRIYIKDISFESPLSPSIFDQTNWKPEVNIELTANNKKVGDKDYEVTLAITVTMTHEKNTVLVIEVKQSGIFNIDGVEGDQLNHLLGSYCPNILFPYAREVISDVVVRGGFPQLILAPVNFDAIYEESKKKAANKEK